VKTPSSHAQNHSIALRECLILGGLLLLLTLVMLATGSTARLDQTLYDRLLQTQNRPARDDIIIVAIDDYSLAELGKWPWPRSRHAALINQLNQGQALAIGVDILFSEAEVTSATASMSNSSSESDSGDARLARAIAAKSNVVLPLISEQSGKGLRVARPLQSLSQAAFALGHIHIELDNDGVARSVFLREGMQKQWWPHFALALHDLGLNIKRDLNDLGARNDKTEGDGVAQLKGSTSFAKHFSNDSKVWRRDWQMHIPYYGSSGHFSTVPYVAVLRGEVPEDFFRGKYVLVGPTATGMADAFPTPVTSNEGTLSGIEINANILASLLDGRSITPLNPWLSAVISCVMVLGALLCCFLFSPRVALVTLAMLCLSLLVASFILLRSGVWLAPSSTIIVLLITYPLWSWRRLEAAIGFLDEEFMLLDQEPHLLPEFNPDLTIKDHTSVSTKKEIQDKLERNISAMRAAARRVRDLRQFVTDSLYSLPDATLVTTTDGNVVLTNPTAISYFQSIGMPQVIDTLVPYLFSSMSHPHTEYLSLNTDTKSTQNIAFSWWHILDLQQTQLLSKGVEVIDPQNRNLIIKSAPCYSGQKVLIGWIISILDISEIRQAERRRDETLHFISHDMRGPQASILALIELQKNTKTAIAHEDFLNRIEKAATTTLSLADSFVQLAHAESNEYRYTDLDFQDLLIDATEEMWTLARSKRIKIVTEIPEGDYPVRVDRSLMTRVLTNLLSNAIKYSPSDTTVTCSLEFNTKNLNDSIICRIQDQGYGIARSDQSRLFQRFQRLGHGNTAESIKNDGIGLGMVFIKTVIDRHFAHISFTSIAGEGTCFTIEIPVSNI
jgi:CHASE2 domain-containing sensor protein/signal transduction histidine kinase